MNLDWFFSNVISWVVSLLSFVWNNILSIKVGSIKLYIWVLGVLVIGGALSLIFRFRPHAPDTESGLRSASNFRERARRASESRAREKAEARRQLEIELKNRRYY